MKNLILVLSVFLAVSQANWNNPYIDTDETIQLKYGMSKEDVLKYLGHPLYVEKGWPNKDLNEIIWIYEVRTIQVSSKKNFSIGSEGGDFVKSSSSKRPDKKIHKLELSFKNGKLDYWKPLREKELIDNSQLPIQIIEHENTKNYSSEKKWRVRPKFSIIKEEWDLVSGIQYYDQYGNPSQYSSWNGTSEYINGCMDFDCNSGDFRIGLDIFRKVGKLNMGLDFSIGGNGHGIMLFLDKKLLGFHWIASFGLDSFKYYDSTGTFKFGVFKDIKSYSIGLESIHRSSIDFNYDAGSAIYLTMKFSLRS